MLIPLLAVLALTQVDLIRAQESKAYRIGVIHEGGPFGAAVDGLRDGLGAAGFEEGKHYVLDIRDVKGDTDAISEAATSLERKKVDLIYAIGTSVTTPVKRATTKTPIVFAVGSDPVVAGFVESFARPAGRLTGVHYLSGDLTAKRLEILKTIVPGLRKAVTFYNPTNTFALRTLETARKAARELGVEIVERRVATTEELRSSVTALRAQDADAYLYTPDAMVLSQAKYIIDAARAKRLPTMFAEHSLVAQGALVAYGVSYHEVGRLSARHVQLVLTGTSPQNLAVESLSRVGLSVNLNTARDLGITIQQSVLVRADKIVEDRPSAGSLR
jgi:putative ABC transport system substrate-binding protein